MPAKPELYTRPSSMEPLLPTSLITKVLESYFPKLYQDLPLDTP